MIEVKGLYKYFDNEPVLEDINIQFRPGNCSLIIGASGSGKTVLLKNIVGLYEPDKGEILYNEHNFTKMTLSERKLFRQEMGMLFQGSALFDFATVEENIMFPMDFFTNWSREEKLERVNFCLKRVMLQMCSTVTVRYLCHVLQITTTTTSLSTGFSTPMVISNG